MSANRLAMFLAIGLGFSLCSCEEERSSGLNELPTYPTTMKVLLNGEPAEGVEVKLHPKGTLEGAQAGQAVPTPRGRTDAEGNVSFFTYNVGDGVPAGEFAATFEFIPIRQYGSAISFGESRGGSRSLPDKLGGKYADPDSSGHTFTVTEGENKLGEVNLEADLEAIEAQQQAQREQDPYSQEEEDE